MRRTNMWKVVMTALLVCAVFVSGCSAKSISEQKEQKQVDHETIRQLEKLDVLSDQLYRKVSEGDIVDARNTLVTLESQLLEIRFADVTSPAGAQALSETVQQGVKVFNSVKFSMEDGQLVAAQLRLAADALTHKEQPMWLQYYRVLQDDVGVLQAAIEKKSQTELLSTLERLARHYAMVRTSALIQRDESQIVKIDSLFAFLRSQSEGKQPVYTELEGGTDQLKASFDELFGKKDEAAYVPIGEVRRPIFWAFGLGSTILMALGYALIRMVQYERSVVTTKRRFK
jgi:sporulation protein YpjB